MVKSRHLGIGDVLKEERRERTEGLDFLDIGYVLDTLMTLFIFLCLSSLS